MSDSFDPRGRPVSRKKAAARGMDDGWTVTGTLITGIGFWGLIGWGLSNWTGWIGFFPIGVLLGAAAGVYLVCKQAEAPPPLLDISKKQDGGLMARHARRLREQQDAERDAAAERPSDDGAAGTLGDGAPSGATDSGDDQGHTESPRQ